MSVYKINSSTIYLTGTLTPAGNRQREAIPCLFMILVLLALMAVIIKKKI